MQPNEGIIQHGGSMNAGALAVGRRARAIGRIDAAASSLGDRDDIAARLREITALLVEHADELEQPDDLLAATGTVAEELARPEPNRLTLSSLLSAIASAASGVTGIAAAITALRAAIGI